MREQRKTRDAASELLIALRKAMGKTQQTFAVEVLKTAITTIARYESSNPPPRGDVLLRLGEIADEHELHEIGDGFRLLYREEMQKRLGPPLVISKATHTRAASAHLSLPLYGEHEISAAYWLVILLHQLKWDKDRHKPNPNYPDQNWLQNLARANPNYKQNVIDAISSLRNAARKYFHPVDRKLLDSQLSERILSTIPSADIERELRRREKQPQPSAKKTSRRKK